MFRRKEEGLFDATTDQNQIQDEHDQDEKTANSSTAQSATQPAVVSSGSNNAAYGSASSTPSTAQQPGTQQPGTQAAPRPNAAAPTANFFRPTPNSAAPASSADLTRNRLPEARQAATATPPNFTAPITVSGDKLKSGKRVLTVGNDILLKGEIATCDRLVIEGKVDATLNDVHTVEIAECGSFKGSAQIEDAEISGLFEGDLTVRGRLVIYATGKVRGKISYGEIEIERGGELTGEIKIAGASAVASRPITRNSAQKEERVAA